MLQNKNNFGAGQNCFESTGELACTVGVIEPLNGVISLLWFISDGLFFEMQ